MSLVSDGCGMSFCYFTCLLLFTLITSRSGLGPMVSSATCEPSDLDLKRKKGPYLMPLFVLSFVFKKTLRIHYSFID